MKIENINNQIDKVISEWKSGQITIDVYQKRLYRLVIDLNEALAENPPTLSVNVTDTAKTNDKFGNS